MSEDAPAAKDTPSWQEGLDKSLPEVPSPVYIGGSLNMGGPQSGTTTKVRKIVFKQFYRRVLGVITDG